ncbi:hypothetical protein LMG24076_03858 [Trinickia soli]|jgi:hypothetical protein|nr:hypothetical protein LMG24076_03858 [Trinickia soli]
MKGSTALPDITAPHLIWRSLVWLIPSVLLFDGPAEILR